MAAPLGRAGLPIRRLRSCGRTGSRLGASTSNALSRPRWSGRRSRPLPMCQSASTSSPRRCAATSRVSSRHRHLSSGTSARRRPGARGEAAMITFILRRLMAAVPVLAVVTILVFSLLYFAPGDPATIIGGDLATPQEIARIRSVLGLDQPFHVRLAIFIGQLLTGDLGIAIFSNLPVTHLIAQR